MKSLFSHKSHVRASPTPKTRELPALGRHELLATTAEGSCHAARQKLGSLPLVALGRSQKLVTEKHPKGDLGLVEQPGPSMCNHAQYLSVSLALKT